ncbi:hypothetical protein AURDEDRAFT_17999, partial [Auricularia subglabra TFB-10046 SS5]
WGPDESSSALWNERSYLAGILVGAVAYGVHATLFFITLGLLWSQKRAHPQNRRWIAFVLLLFTLSSLANGAQFKFTQMIYIDNRNYPGGPSAYLIEKQTETPALICLISYIVNNWMQDGLILYRFWIIYGRRTEVVILPVIMFVSTIGISCTFMSRATGITFFETPTANLLTSYFSISIALNVILTIAIATKLLLVRRRLARHTSPLVHDSPHFSAAAMLIESAVLYSVCGVIFLVPWGLADPVQNLILPTLGQAESIAPLLIIMRVAQGHAWSSDT